MENQPTIILNNESTMPILGLGVWQMEDGAEAENAVTWALEAGYRHIDTAMIYQNETSVGTAVRESSIPREDIFVTTKLWRDGFDDPEAALEASLERLGLDYVDLYLIHWPASPTPASVWEALEKLYAGKRTRAIGVSNYSIDDLEDLLSYADIPPAVNQVKCSPFDFDKELFDYCASKHIALEAYSPLTRGEKLHDVTIETLAEKYTKSPAQIMIRWCIEHGIVVIPKSSNRERIIENADVFDFSIEAQDMRTLDSLS
jgi:diketogulonate reductase-like aldo/keto reductase